MKTLTSENATNLAMLSSKNFKLKKGIKKEQWYLLLLTVPFIAAVFLFNYLPLFGWVYAFFDYHPGIPLSKTQFIAFDKFIRLANQPGDLIRVMKNTLALSSLAILCSPLPVILAVLLTEVKSTWFKKAVQTFSTLPNFVSWIIVYSLSFSLLSSEGTVNQLLMGLGIIDRPFNVIGNPEQVWGFQLALHIWKTLGWSSIIYLAAIAGIDGELYDAAKVDGAGRFRSIWHITVPGVLETYIVLLLLAVGSLLNAGSTLDQYLVFYNVMVANNIEVLDLYVYRRGIVNGDYATATAVGIFKTVISVTLLFTVNAISKKARGKSIV